MVNPYHKIQFIERYLKEESNSVLPEEYQRIVKVLSGKEEDECVLAAYTIYKTPCQRNYVEALLFSEIKHEHISSLFGVDINTIKEYSNIFYDINSFKNKIDKIEYLNYIKSSLIKKLSEAKKNKEDVSPDEMAEMESVFNSIKIMLMYLKLGNKYIEHIVGGKDISEDVVVNLIYSSVKDAVVTATTNKAMGNSKEAKDWYRIAATLISSLKTLSSGKDKDTGDNKDIVNKIKLRIDELSNQVYDINTGDIVG